MGDLGFCTQLRRSTEAVREFLTWVRVSRGPDSISHHNSGFHSDMGQVNWSPRSYDACSEERPGQATLGKIQGCLRSDH